MTLGMCFECKKIIQGKGYRPGYCSQYCYEKMRKRTATGRVIHTKEAKSDLERLYAEEGKLFKIDGKTNEFYKYTIVRGC